MINAIQEAVINSRFWKDLTSRLATIERPEWFDAKFKTAVTVEQNTRQAADGALANQITTVFANLDGNLAGVREELEATVTEYKAFAASATSALTELDGNMTAAETSISSLTTKTNSTATAVTNLQATVSNVNTKAQQAFTLASDVNGDIQGSWVTKFDVNGYVTGFGLGLDVNAGKTPKSTFAVLADNFVIGHPSSTDTIPFTVSGGKTYIKQALIGAAAIDTLRIAGNAVIVPASEIYTGPCVTGAVFYSNFDISGLGANEYVPVHFHIGLVATEFDGLVAIHCVNRTTGVSTGLASDTIPAGSRSYLGASDSLKNGMYKLQITFSSWPSQQTRISLLTQVCKR